MASVDTTTEDNHLHSDNAPDFACKYHTVMIGSATSALNGFTGIGALRPEEPLGLEILAVRALASDVGTSIELDLFIGEEGEIFDAGATILDGTMLLDGDLTWVVGGLLETPTLLAAGKTLHWKIVAAVGTNLLVTLQVRYRPLLGTERNED